ncbi:Oidioi.mRNA.OKI2018_I69.chr2.g4567.t1.cds [Oikopleura dioica]|uniref:Oidioi.mRNA.OKI2018_I69.chr2.g4567.t1.cds n=1 Tax=Oikopleura dioica TaxID=34765 RepID=A0ABN7T6V3_OIKDI|nr:Oidioi.mRNA.OKI2018_I69.chr2.g4567.t1.cds [Oikopleura dioica]
MEKEKKTKKPGSFGITREIVHTLLVFVALITCLITRYSKKWFSYTIHDPGGGEESIDIAVGISSCCLNTSCYPSGGTGYFPDATQKASIDARENLTISVFLLSFGLLISVAELSMDTKALPASQFQKLKFLRIMMFILVLFGCVFSGMSAKSSLSEGKLPWIGHCRGYCNFFNTQEGAISTFTEFKKFCEIVKKKTPEELVDGQEKDPKIGLGVIFIFLNESKESTEKTTGSEKENDEKGASKESSEEKSEENMTEAEKIAKKIKDSQDRWAEKQKKKAEEEAEKEKAKEVEKKEELSESPEMEKSKYEIYKIVEEEEEEHIEDYDNKFMIWHFGAIPRELFKFDLEEAERQEALLECDDSEALHQAHLKLPKAEIEIASDRSINSTPDKRKKKKKKKPMFRRKTIDVIDKTLLLAAMFGRTFKRPNSACRIRYGMIPLLERPGDLESPEALPVTLRDAKYESEDQKQALSTRPDLAFEDESYQLMSGQATKTNWMPMIKTEQRTELEILHEMINCRRRKRTSYKSSS